MRARFGDWTYDSKTRELLGPDGVVHISKKAFELLGALLECRPDARSKQELYERLWPDSFVSEATLASLIGDLRKALHDRSRDPLFIRTVHGYGYAFCGTATEEPAEDRGEKEGLFFRLCSGKREVDLVPGDNYLGRIPGAVLWLDSPTVSRRHARIVVSGEKAMLEDLDSKNGTFLRGQRVTSAVPLENGEEFRVGSVSIILRVYRGAEPTTTHRG